MHTYSAVSTLGTPLGLKLKGSADRSPGRKNVNTGADHIRTCKTRWQGFERKYSCKPAARLQVVSALDGYAAEIQPLGLRLWRIGGDGRCLFRALAQGAHQLDKGQPLKVAEEQQAADELRKCVCNELRSRQDDISPFLEVPFEQYIESMSQASTWGGEPELSVSPECLLRPVDVYMNGATGLQVMSSYSSPDCKQSEPVMVLFNGIGHYDLLIDNSPASKL